MDNATTTLVTQMESADMAIINGTPKLKAKWASIEIGDTVHMGTSPNGAHEFVGPVTRKSDGCITITTAKGHTISKTGRLIRSCKLIK